jgi:AraC-like DNA-binding protein
MKEDKSSAPTPGILIRIETEELEELAKHIKHADIELIQVGRTKSPSSLTQLSFDNINLQIGSYGSSCISNATSDRERFGLVYKVDKENSTKCNGYEIDRKSFLLYGNNAEHFALNDGPCRWSYITMKPDYFEEYIVDTVEGKLETGRGASSCLNCRDQLSIDTFYTMLDEIAGLAETSPLLLKNGDIKKGMEYSLLETQIAILGSTLNVHRARNWKGKQSHGFIIKLSIDFLKANSYRPIHVLDLCSALNVRMRTLYYAFQEFYGLSPIRYLRLVRYARARKDLINAEPVGTTVTEIATKWHFWHFGRFSIEYKNLYGESPSETLNKNTGI